MKFLDDYIYLITFGVIIILFLVLLLSKKTMWLIKYKKITSLTFAFLTIANMIWFITFESLIKGYHHLLFTDMCPFISLISIPFFIIGKNKGFKIIMPWLIIGATLTMLGGTPDFQAENASSGSISYIRHSIMLLKGIFLILILPKYERKELFLPLIITGALLIWIPFACLTPYGVTGDIKWLVFSTGMFKETYEKQEIVFNGHTEFVSAYAFLKGTHMPWPVPTILMYVLCSCSAVGFGWASQFLKVKK